MKSKVFSGRNIVFAGFALIAAAVPLAGSVAQDAALTEEQVTQGRQLFGANACGACHTLADGGGAGAVGPSLDGNAKLDVALVTERITKGQGVMPAFGAMMDEAQIQLLARYVVHAKK